MNKEQFTNELKKINISISNEQLNSLEIFCDLLLEYNSHTNLTAIKTVEGVYLKHFYDSLTILNCLDENSSILDIGTGAGFPGLVLAIIRPDLNLTLLDSNNKKIKFLNYIIDNLNLKNVSTVHARAEEFARLNIERFDYVTSRAVASIRILLELGIPTLKVNGKFILMKSSIDTELDEARDTVKILNSSIINTDSFLLPIENSKRNNITIIKNKSTDKIYPRDYDKILKKPLKILLK